MTVERVTSKYVEGLKLSVRDGEAQGESLRIDLARIGEELAKRIVEDHLLSNKRVKTPMGVEVEGWAPSFPRVVVVTTRDDFSSLCEGFGRVIDNVSSGYMDFKGARGEKALTAPLAAVQLPDEKEPVHSVIIAKSVLATGCTAIRLVKEVVRKYAPKNVFIASVFYSNRGVQEMVAEFPHYDLYVVGDRDEIDQEGMLVPGVGDLDARLRVA